MILNRFEDVLGLDGITTDKRTSLSKALSRERRRGMCLTQLVMKRDSSVIFFTLLRAVR
jgi:hypothetical protein